MRDRFLAGVASILFVLIGIGLFYNQIIRFPYYSRLSKNNSIRILPIDGPRGNIYDRNGMGLVSSRLSFDVVIIYQELKDKQKFARILSDVFGMGGRDIARVFDKAISKPYSPVTILEDVDKERAIKLEEATFDISGLMIETRSRRHYIYNHAGSHIYGYLSEVGPEELEDLKDYGYRMRDLIGREGLEKQYETFLRGIDGGTQVEVDSRGRQTRILGLKEPSSGKDLYLTIDASLQSLGDKLLGERKGALIAMNPKTGEVLALASHPAFDPNVFIKAGSSRERAGLLTDRIGRPLSNRAVSGLYAPGSVFKIVTSAAALETMKINLNTYFFCNGSYKLGNAQFDCWKEGGHGSQNITLGLKNSCNVFFYNTGRITGVDSLEIFARMFGFGRLTGIDLPDEVKGVVPGKSWKQLRKKNIWYEGETLNYAIGQGYLLVTPIQVLCMMSAVANNGNLVRPYIVSRVDINNIPASKPRNIGLKDGTVWVIRKGLYDVVNSEDGTGKRAKVEGASVAGKTGTAQNPQGRTHAWFAGFAPYEDPKVCLVVFLEHGGKGGVEPASIAHEFFKEAKSRGYI